VSFFEATNWSFHGWDGLRGWSIWSSQLFWNITHIQLGFFFDKISNYLNKYILVIIHLKVILI
jgi:hypothetical protein